MKCKLDELVHMFGLCFVYVSLVFIYIYINTHLLLCSTSTCVCIHTGNIWHIILCEDCLYMFAFAQGQYAAL